MECKKCGVNIADASKFCGYCGNQIEQIPVFIEKSVQTIEQNIEQVSTTDESVFQKMENIKNIEKTMVVEPINIDKESYHSNKNKKGNKNLFILLDVVLIVTAIILIVLVIN